ncbi:MAG: hypothetical protein Q9195_009113 [Heterodermia aff. obscurata]
MSGLTLNVVIVGAGIQIPPNAARILSQWGLLPALAKHSKKPIATHFRSWKSGQLLFASDLRLKHRFGTDFYNIHRADFHADLVEAAEALGVVFRLGATVSHIDFHAPSVSLRSGEIVPADVVIGADGLNSACKEILLGPKAAPLPTGDLAYRLTVRESDMRPHADLHGLLDIDKTDCWMGPDAFLVGYLLKEDGLYNIALICPDTLPEAVDVAKATPGEMQDVLRGWDPRLQTLLGLVEKTAKWRMLTSSEMESWGHEAGKFVLMGDACHASLPYLAQGAAQAIEDAGVLAALFAKIKHPSQLKPALQLYEKLRKPRTSRITQGSLDQGLAYMLHDGPEQRERDRLLGVKGAERYPIRSIDPGWQEWMLGFDPVAEVERVWGEVGEGVNGFTLG